LIQAFGAWIATLYLCKLPLTIGIVRLAHGIVPFSSRSLARIALRGTCGCLSGNGNLYQQWRRLQGHRHVLAPSSACEHHANHSRGAVLEVKFNATENKTVEGGTAARDSKAADLQPDDTEDLLEDENDDEDENDENEDENENDNDNENDENEDENEDEVAQAASMLQDGEGKKMAHEDDDKDSEDKENESKKEDDNEEDRAAVEENASLVQDVKWPDPWAMRAVPTSSRRRDAGTRRRDTSEVFNPGQAGRLTNFGRRRRTPTRHIPNPRRRTTKKAAPTRRSTPTAPRDIRRRRTGGASTPGSGRKKKPTARRRRTPWKTPASRYTPSGKTRRRGL